MLAALLLLVARHQSALNFEFNLRSGQGLTIKADGVPIVLGSGIQYYEAGWTKGYFSTNNSEQAVTKPDADTVELAFTGADGRAKGSERIHRDGDRLSAHYHLEWSGDHQVEVELTAGLIWAPALQFGSLTADDHPTRDLTQTMYTPDQDMERRRYAPDAKSFQYQAPIGAVAMQSSLPMTLFDARGYRQGYAEGRSVWWYGALDIPVSPGKPVDLDVTWTVRPTEAPALKTQTLAVTPQTILNAQAPDLSTAPLIPKPKIAVLDYGKPAAIPNLFTFPAGLPRYWDLFKEMLSRRYVVPPPLKGATPIKVDGGVSRMHIHPGGFTIDITPTSVSVLGEEDEGLRNGMYRLAQLAFVKNGQLYWPTGHISDQPNTVWRGVHLFGGPESRPFQHRLWDRVLLPLGMNKAVIECERAAWESTPLDPSTHPMAKADLAGLFDDYRKVGVEPIPLIQSLGHMEWFFDGKRRLDLAVNPEQPYTIDPRKHGTKAAVEALWNEAIDLLKPSTIHFGCDEIDQVGMSPHDPEVTTNIWREQMANLSGIAHEHSVSMMIWGDEALAPGEAVDAMNGDTKQEAANRRAAIPEGTMVCDWHYAADPDPAKYYPTLQLWKREGLVPVASTWYQPENIQGFDVAAGIEHVGTLQTTWAGYESSERGMIENPEQFTAMVLAADYGWSGRTEPLEKLGYDPAIVFRQLYFGSPSPVKPEPGYAFALADQGKPVQIGTTTFFVGTPVSFRSTIMPGLADAPTDLVIDASKVGLRTVRHLALAVDTLNSVSDGEEIATVKLELAGGESIVRRLVYGHHVRAAADRRLTPYAERGSGMCAVGIDLPNPGEVRRVSVHCDHAYAGLRLFGVTGF